MKPVARVLLSATMCVVGTAPAAAQFATSARAAGMAGAYEALATGSEAIRWNPANLGFADHRPAWSLALPNVNLAGTVLGPGVYDVKDILDLGNNLTDQDRQAFLAAVPSGGMGVSGGATVPWFSLSVGPFAVGASTTLLAGGSVGKDLIDLMLYARQYGGVDVDRLGAYRVGNTVARDAAFSTVSVSYGHTVNSLIPLPFPVSVGVTARYVKGHDLQEGRIFEPRVDLAALDIFLPALAVRSPGGTGFGVDVGVAAQPLPNVTLGVTVANILQRMSWDQNLTLRGDVFSGSDMAEMSVQDVYDRLQSRPFDAATAPLEAFELANDMYRETYFPSVMRMGAALRHGGTALGATYSTTVGKGELATGWPHYIALGVEQKVPVLSFIILRGGVANSLDGASELSGGATLQLGPVGISAAISKLNGNSHQVVTGDFASTRFGQRMAAGNGVGLNLGLDLRAF
jgi:hypothetical protein